MAQFHLVHIQTHVNVGKYICKLDTQLIDTSQCVAYLKVLSGQDVHGGSKKVKIFI